MQTQVSRARVVVHASPAGLILMLLVDLDTPLGCRSRREVVPRGSATVAVVDGHTVSVHVARLERSGPGVDGELTGAGTVDGARALDLCARLTGHDQEVEAGALEVDVSDVVMELDVPAGSSCPG